MFRLEKKKPFHIRISEILCIRGESLFCVGMNTQTEGVRAVKKELPDPAIIYKMERLCSLFFF